MRVVVFCAHLLMVALTITPSGQVYGPLVRVRHPALGFQRNVVTSAREQLLAWAAASGDFHASMLPPNAIYTERQHLQFEQESLFPQTWSYIGHLGQFSADGKGLITWDIGGRLPVFVTQQMGEVKGFVNLCRHRAAQLVANCPEQQKGTCSERSLGPRVSCPYHGWEYETATGRLAKAVKMKDIKAFKPRQYSLPTVHLDSLGPLLFCKAHPASEALTKESDLDATFPGFRQRLGDLSVYQFVKRVTYVMRCNWKVFADNYLDGGYHIAHLHPGLASSLDLDSYRVELLRNHSIQAAGSTAAPGAATAGSEVPGRVVDPIYAWLFPNTAINKYGNWLDVHTVTPISERECSVMFDYFLDSRCATFVDPTRLELELQSSRTIQMEDMDICESVQRGLESGGYLPSRFAGPEGAAHHFAMLLAAHAASPTVT
eukprot:g17300.t1